MSCIRRFETKPKLSQGGFVEKEGNAFVFGMLSHALAKQVAAAFEENSFARFYDDFPLRKAKDLGAFGDKDERVLSDEYVARLLFDTLMIFAEAETARLEKTAMRRVGKIARDSKKIGCRF